MLKLIAFDLDGTIADTLADLGTAVNVALESEGLPVYPIDDYRHLVGNGIDRLMQDAMANAYNAEGAERMKAVFQSYYAAHSLDQTDAYPGIAQLLAELDAAHISTAVISNKPHQFVPTILQKLYPDHEFFVAWGKQDDVARKPSPEALNKAIGMSGFDKSEVLYVGDSNVDVVFAHNAGVKVCGVSWGFRGAKELRDAGADYIVNSAEELYELISSL